MAYFTLLVAVGGALGSALRYIISKVFASGSPVLTYVVVVNIVGCLIAGLIAGYLDKHVHNEATRLFLITGICGGFTTFSAFSLDFINLVNKGSIELAFVYVLLSVIGSLVAVFTGYMMVSKWMM